MSPLRIALQTLRANPLRTVLSTLGIVMGGGSLVAVLAIGDTGCYRMDASRVEQVVPVSCFLLSPLATPLS